MTNVFERWSLTEYNVDLDSLTVFPKNDERYHPERVQPTITPEVGKTYFLLFVRYTSGDSFNPSSTTNHEYVDLYEDREVSHDMGRRIRADLERDTFLNRHRKGFVEKKLEIVFANGVIEKKDYWPWKGHFESVEEIAVIEVTFAGQPRKVTF